MQHIVIFGVLPGFIDSAGYFTSIHHWNQPGLMVLSGNRRVSSQLLFKGNYFKKKEDTGENNF